MTSWLFVHSPFLGPSSLRRMADAAADAGDGVALPDLTRAVVGPSPIGTVVEVAADAAGSLTGTVTVVGHSGAGAFLPAIGARLAQGARLVFVDAAIPPADRPHTTAPHLAAMLDDKAVDGTLPRWLDFWPDEVIAELLPRADDVESLEADMPHLPRSFHDHPVPVPARWADGSCAYLQLTDAYDDAADAEARGWPTARYDGTHLSIHTEADAVLAAIRDLVARLGRER